MRKNLPPARLSRRQFLRRTGLLLTTSLWGAAIEAMSSSVHTYPLEVLPPEHQRVKDPVTGAELLFVTTHPGADLNSTSMNVPSSPTSCCCCSFPGASVEG
ncbi:MAG: hypothetical protein RMM08_03105 [Armatimonadota bacterium]|nr:hypothetical protein [Armatimonadota bacterium]